MGLRDAPKPGGQAVGAHVCLLAGLPDTGN